MNLYSKVSISKAHTLSSVKERETETESHSQGSRREGENSPMLVQAQTFSFPFREHTLLLGYCEAIISFRMTGNDEVYCMDAMQTQ